MLIAFSRNGDPLDIKIILSFSVIYHVTDIIEIEDVRILLDRTIYMDGRIWSCLNICLAVSLNETETGTREVVWTNKQTDKQTETFRVSSFWTSWQTDMSIKILDPGKYLLTCLSRIAEPTFKSWTTFLWLMQQNGLPIANASFGMMAWLTIQMIGHLPISYVGKQQPNGCGNLVANQLLRRRGKIELKN